MLFLRILFHSEGTSIKRKITKIWYNSLHFAIFVRLLLVLTKSARFLTLAVSPRIVVTSTTTHIILSNHITNILTKMTCFLQQLSFMLQWLFCSDVPRLLSDFLQLILSIKCWLSRGSPPKMLLLWMLPHIVYHKPPLRRHPRSSLTPTHNCSIYQTK